MQNSCGGNKDGGQPGLGTLVNGLQARQTSGPKRAPHYRRTASGCRGCGDNPRRRWGYLPLALCAPSTACALQRLHLHPLIRVQRPRAGRIAPVAAQRADEPHRGGVLGGAHLQRPAAVAQFAAAGVQQFQLADQTIAVARV